MDAIKAGARHSKKDQALLKQVKDNAAGIVEAAIELGADAEAVEEAVEEGVAEAEKSARPDTLVAFGSAVKALGEGKIGGYLVRFSDPDNKIDRDLYGEYFTKSTYYGPRQGDGVDTLFHHGMPVAEGLEALADRLLPPLKATVDEVGIWAELVLSMADEYERMIYDLVAAGKLGWSSGAPGHMVRRVGPQITRWPIAEGSLTPMPAEPRNRVLTLKALSDTPASVDIGTTRRTAAATTKGETMSELQGAAPVAETTTATLGGVTQTVQVDVEALVNQAVTKALSDYQAKLEAEPATKTAGYYVPNVSVRHEALTDDMAFKFWLKWGNESPPDVLKAMRRKFNRIGGLDMVDGSMKATLAEGTDAQGGYWVPTTYANEIIEPLTNASYLRRAGARVMDGMQGTDSFRVPSITYTSAATIGGEGSAYTQTEPTAGELEFNPYKLKRLALATEEMVEDSRYDVWSMVLQPDFEQSFAEGENTYFTTGTGSGQPQGVVTGATTGVTAASQTAITADELIDLFYSVDFKYREDPSFAWMMNDSTLKVVRKLKDGEGNYLWAQGFAGQPEAILGKRVITNNAMSAIATGNSTVVVGAFRYYWIAAWPGLQIQRLNEKYADTGHVGFRAFRRVDGNIALSNAFRKLVQA